MLKNDCPLQSKNSLCRWLLQSIMTPAVSLSLSGCAGGKDVYRSILPCLVSRAQKDQRVSKGSWMGFVMPAGFNISSVMNKR